MPEQQTTGIPLEDGTFEITGLCDTMFNDNNIPFDDGRMDQQNQSYMEKRTRDFPKICTCVRVQRTQLCGRAEQLLEKVLLIYDIGTSIGVLTPSTELQSLIEKAGEGFRSQRNTKVYTQEGCALEEEE